jgi:hypothetical protein
MKQDKLTMRATLPAETVSNARNYGGDKETVTRLCVVGKKNGELCSIVEARFYMGRSRDASTVYCSLWVSGEKWCSGSGKAGGYGYHKESAALDAAIRSSGIFLGGANYSTNEGRIDYKKRAAIGGCGSDSMRMALKAIARAAGAKGQLLIV